MSEKEELEKELKEQRPAGWEQIPDIDLYKDQLTEYLKRQHIGFVLGMEEPLTSAMINNYVKAGVLPRAKGKRYDRDHIAYLTVGSRVKGDLFHRFNRSLFQDTILHGKIIYIIQLYEKICRLAIP